MASRPGYSYKDSGYSWLVCTAAFTSTFLTVGFSHAIGIYFVAFLEVFEETAGVTSWISSLNFGITCMAGRERFLLIYYSIISYQSEDMQASPSGFGFGGWGGGVRVAQFSAHFL